VATGENVTRDVGDAVPEVTGRREIAGVRGLVKRGAVGLADRTEPATQAVQVRGILTRLCLSAPLTASAAARGVASGAYRRIICSVFQPPRAMMIGDLVILPIRRSQSSRDSAAERALGE
jgi:hypothetical protein